MIAEDKAPNLEFFTDALSTSIIQKLVQPVPKSKKLRPTKSRIVPDVKDGEGDVQGADDLQEFIEYLSEEIFADLPEQLRTISYAMIQDNPAIAEKYAVPLDWKLIEGITKTLSPGITDSLCSYNLIDEPSDLERFLEPVLASYVTTATAAPPEYTPALTASRPDGCEICGREHMPLTYHHLIPRQIHEKALKRGWHKEWELNKVAWLCRACHSYVHHILSNEELAQSYYDVQLLTARDDVRKFAAWVGKIRWRAR